MKICRTLEEAKQLLESHEGPPEDFELRMAEEALDPVGVNMSIVTHIILGKGWEPKDVIPKEGHTLFLYQMMTTYH